MGQPDFVEFRRDLPIILENLTCPYCGIVLGDGVARDKEHVVGRGFVPRGTLDRQWNLIVNACGPCNKRKSDLEDDISAVTMQPDVVGRIASDDPRLRAAAERKARRSFSRRTGKPVAVSGEQLTVTGSLMPGVTYAFDLVCAPQLDHDRAFRLAWYHLTGFFYMISFDGESGRGSHWPGSFAPVAAAPRCDWGNAQFRWFQEHVAAWPIRLYGAAAAGFFKVMIRRWPGGGGGGGPAWAWALEWNQSYRLFGFFGADDAVLEAAAGLPALSKFAARDANGDGVLARAETPLGADEDRLFEPPPEKTPSAPNP